jgi:hypothetical protein
VTGDGLFPSAEEPSAVAHFRETGWVHVRDRSAGALARDLQGWAGEIAAWPEEGGWMHHRELTDGGPALCRTENMVPYHPRLRALLCEGTLLAAASALLGEPAVLYKDKLNYKLPGGAGYAPHQDAPAYRFVDIHVSCMLAIDDAGQENGCLEVVSRAHDRIWPMDDTGCIRADVVAGMTWLPVPVRAGDVLWFHSRTPHRSGPNPTPRARRALYPTYNARSEGDLRENYYRQRAAELAAAPTGDRVAVSLIGDFQGRPVV